MLDTSRKTPWYGVLNTSQGQAPVIFDPKLPEAPPGKVYLYNAARGQIVQYVRSVLEQKLEDMSAAQKRKLKAELQGGWCQARDAFLQNRQPVSASPAITKLSTQPALEARKFEEEMLAESDDYPDELLDEA